ncbi:hypothetical protein POM88_052962 [Heracleum sosnowskyi]|uniref:Uncharacterized protein n=1 Tax=Heracleum sosnowskyi TaxID=360622 RepID=A0AAD8GRD6_9APIA|nr:hypothetical protein POM88_052962 [Heracleum sosnowskyi]
MAGDIATLAKARRELEELYSGIPDESVNLTFQDFAQVKQLPTTHNMERKASGTLVISSNNNIVKSSSSSSSALTKLPSLDFSKAFEDASIIHHHNRNNINLQHGHQSSRNNSYYVGTTTDHHQDSTVHGRKFTSSFMDHYGEEAALHTSQLGTSTDRPPPRASGQDSNYNVNYGHGNHASHHNHHHHLPDHHNSHHQAISNTASGYHHHHHQQQSAGFTGLSSDHHHDIISSSGTSSMMMSNNFMDGSSIGGTRRRRPGIPHSNICSICSVYIYLFRNNRCLVCGRVYCRQCVSIGMGEMTEGRKCIQCLGKRFSQRYIDRAGKTGGCCMGFLDSSSTSRAKQREIEWAEKGARKSGGSNTNTNTGTATPSRNYNNYSRSEVSPRTPTHGVHRSTPPPPDFSSPYSPYSTHSPASTYHFPL